VAVAFGIAAYFLRFALAAENLRGVETT